MSDEKSSSSGPQRMTTNLTSMNPKDREKFLDELEFPFCDEVNKYEKMAKIGQGTFGEVFKARHKRTKKIVALKKVLMENEKEGVRIGCCYSDVVADEAIDTVLNSSL
jgi:cyclin-dependent kinase 9